MSAAQEFVIERRLSATPDRVFAAWHEPDGLREWVWGSLADRVAVDRLPANAGFDATTHRPDGEHWTLAARFTTFEPGRRLEFDVSWSAPMGYECEREHAIVTLVAADAGTMMRFEVEGLPPEACAAHRDGWNNAFDHLEQLLLRP